MNRFIAFLLVSAVIVACSSREATPRPAATTCSYPLQPILSSPDEVAAYTLPASPFPADQYTVEADTPTGLRADVQGQGVLFQDKVNHSDGWAQSGIIRLDFTGTVVTTSVPRSVTESLDSQSPIQIVDLQAMERVPFVAKPGQQHSRVYLFPWRPLKQGTRHAIVVRSTLRPAIAPCVGRNAAFAAILQGNTPSGFRTHFVKAVRDTYAALQAHADTLGLPVEEILLAVPYTTQSILPDLVAKAEAQRQRNISPYRVEVFRAIEEDGNFNRYLETQRFPPLPQDLKLERDVRINNVAYIVLGRYDSEDYRANGYWQDRPQRVESIEFLLALPRLSRVRLEYRAALGSPPRFPVVVFGHGLTACKETLLGVAHKFAEFGLAVVGIDVVEHGTRISDPGDSCGQTILEGLRFIRFLDPEIGRDNFRQTVLDEVQLVQMLATNANLDYLAGATQPVTDPATSAFDSTGLLRVDRFGYIGQSLGGFLGTLLTAVEPRITTSVLNVPGGGIADYAALIDPNAYQPLDLNFPDGYLYENLSAVEVVFGPADPLHYAPYATRFTAEGLTSHRPKNVLVQQAMGDGIVPARLTENLAGAFGAVQVEPIYHPVEGLVTAATPYISTGSHTVALQQYIMPEKNVVPGGKDWDPHYFLILSNDPAVVTAAQNQAAHFLWTGIVGGSSEVINGFALP